jgi:hypothetical protein
LRSNTAFQITYHKIRKICRPGQFAENGCVHYLPSITNLRSMEY